MLPSNVLVRACLAGITLSACTASSSGPTGVATTTPVVVSQEPAPVKPSDDVAPQPELAGNGAAVGGMRPSEAPPADRVERYETRAGYVWIPGRWSWPNGKWVWVDGGLERERANMEWKPGSWQLVGSEYAWTDGHWSDKVAAATRNP
jgi:hypothetical protein